MPPKKILLFPLLCLIFCSILNAGIPHFSQNFYGIEQGMASNLSKAVLQDRDGLIWIATDGGLIEYDGQKFSTITEGLPSLYVKDLKLDPQGRVLAVTDMGIGYILKRKSGYYYRPLIQGSVVEDGNHLFYPKNVIFDSKGRMWISEAHCISLYRNGKLRKYLFDAKFWTDSYGRSFLFAEDPQGCIWASSWRGYFFRYSEKSDKFQQVDFPQQGSFSIDALTAFNSYFYLGTSRGLFSISFIGNSLKLKLLATLRDISSVYPDRDGSLFIATWDNGLYYSGQGSYAFQQIEGLNSRIFSGLNTDFSGGLWACSNDGLCLLKKTTFSSVDPRGYILKAMEGPDGAVYYTDQMSIFKTEGVSKRPKTVFHSSRNSLIYDFINTGKSFYISYRDNFLVEKNSGRVIDLKGDRANRFESDDRNNVWAFLENSKKIIKIAPDGTIKEYAQNYTATANFLKFLNGKLYFGGSSSGCLMGCLDPSTGRVSGFLSENPVSSAIKPLLFDIEYSSGAFYVTSNIGLIRIKDRKASLDPEFKNLPLRAVSSDPFGNLWIGGENGLYLKFKNEILSFNKFDGLPNSTVVQQGINFDRDGRAWIATAGGHAYWQDKINDIRKYPTPSILNLQFRKDGDPLEHGLKSYPSGVNLSAGFAGKIFPDERTKFQVRLLGLDSTWVGWSKGTELTFYKLPEGDYRLQVRAKDSGYLMSDISEVRFRVLPRWYLSSPMIFLYLLAFTGLIVLLVTRRNRLRIKRLQDRQKELKSLVELRTLDLLKEKEKTERLLQDTETQRQRLGQANDLKGQLLSIAAHDLKNSLQTILGYEFFVREEYDLQGEVLEMFEAILRSAKKMLGIITEILESAAQDAAQLELKVESCDMNQLLQGLLLNNEARAAQKNQTIVTNLGEEIFALADRIWITEAIDNLISNAVKYSPLGSKIFISLMEQDSRVLLRIKDQGPGFSEEDREQMFTKFRRLSAKPTGGESSTGLGLSLVKDIVDRHSGRVYLEDTKIGASFVIELKAAK